MPETEEFGAKVSLNENLLEGKNWKPHSGYLLPPKYMNKAAFFPGKKSRQLLETLNWEQKFPVFPLETLCCPGGPEGLTVLNFHRHCRRLWHGCGSRGAPWSEMHVTFHPLSLRHGPIKSERNWGARGASSFRNSSPANDNYTFKRSVLNHTACCSVRINAFAQSTGEIGATQPVFPLCGAAQHGAREDLGPSSAWTCLKGLAPAQPRKTWATRRHRNPLRGKWHG